MTSCPVTMDYRDCVFIFRKARKLSQNQADATAPCVYDELRDVNLLPDNCPLALFGTKTITEVRGEATDRDPS